MGRSPSQLALLLIPLVFACFGLAQSTEAADPTPNHREIVINSIPQIPCAGEKVDLRGFLRIKFGVKEFFSVRTFGPVDIKLEQFSGRGQTTGRKYEASPRLEMPGGLETNELNGKGFGTFKLRFLVTGNPNPPPQGDPNPGNVVRFKLLYTVGYEFSKNKVTSFKATRDICCRGSGCY